MGNQHSQEQRKQRRITTRAYIPRRRKRRGRGRTDNNEKLDGCADRFKPDEASSNEIERSYIT